MNPPTRLLLLTLAGLCAALLAGCGGGSSGSAPGAAGATTSQITPVTQAVLGGTVAVGAPMLNAVVTLKDAAGNTRSAAAAADGSYSGLSIDGLTAPFRIQACGLADGQYACYYALVDKGGTANVTPLTHAHVSLALGTDASALFDGAGAGPGGGAMNAKKQALLDAIGPLLAALGLPADLDFTSFAFSADRTGMDKLLDALKITTGADTGSGNQPTSFVQIEGRIGSAGSVFLGNEDGNSGALRANGDIGVDLRSITTAFQRMSSATGSASETACAASMGSAGIFDAAFSLNIDGNNPVSAATAPAMICHLAAQSDLLGGVVANPAIRDCDFAAADKICTVAFDIVKGDTVFDGAEMAVVLRSGAPAWQLLGRESPYDIHVSAAVQRNLRVDLSDSPPTYTRALSFDVGDNGGAVHAAKVYQRDAAGTGWDATPIALLNDTGCGGRGRLTMQGGSCGSSWLSLDGFGANLAGGDALIDAFYKRGRQVKIELFSDAAGTALVASVFKRVDGVPPKSAALASVPWLELDAATRTSLRGYDGANASFTATWLANAAVSAKDMSFCLSGGCSGADRAGYAQIDGARKDGNGRTLALSSVPAGASSYKQIALYGRNREQMGVQTNYVSCGGRPVCN